MSERRWLEGSPDPIEAELRRAIDDAQARTGDDVAMRRVWGKVSPVATAVLRPRPPRRWQWFVGGVISSAGLAAVLALAFWPARPPAALPAPAIAIAPSSVTAAAPTKTIAREQPAGDRRTVVGPADLRAAAGETLAVDLAGGVAAALAPGAALAVDEQQRPTVRAGAVRFSVPHQAPGATFVVTVAGYRVVVVGTKFRVSNDGDRVAVDVEEGVVEVWRARARLARLAVGESWSGASVPMAVATETPVGAPLAAPPRSRVRAGHLRRQAGAPALALNDRSASAGVSPRGADAQGALAAGDVRRGLELYGEILAAGGPAAENAAYEIGKILRDRLHQPEAALAAWRRYRDLNPDGLLIIETDVSIIETLVRLGDRNGALGEATRFLRAHPDSERRGEIARIAGDLQRAGGDCRAAVQSYDVALKSRRPTLADAVSFGRAACLRVLGDPGAAAAMDQYLRDFPGGQYRADVLRLARETGKSAR